MSNIKFSITIHHPWNLKSTCCTKCTKIVKSDFVSTYQDSPSKLINLIWYILSILFKSPSVIMTSASLLISSKIVKCLSLKKSERNVRDHKTACNKHLDINLCLRSPVPIFLTFSFHFNSVFVYLILSSWVVLIFLVGQTRDPQTAKLSRPHWKNLSRLWIPGSNIFSRWFLKIQSLKILQLWNFSSRISVYWIFELIKIKGQQKIGHSVKYRWIYFLARWTHLQMSRTLKIRS